MISRLESVVWRPALIDVSESNTISLAVDCQGYDVVALQQPANTEGTTITFQGSLDGINFAVINDQAGAAVSVTKSALAAELIQLGADELRGLNKVKVVVGTAQDVDTTIMVGLRAVSS